VLVKKASRKLCMCVDYTDLNKVCPKDSYPLLGIDRLVDGIVDYNIQSLLDAYLGYYQIHMAENDKMSDRGRT